MESSITTEGATKQSEHDLARAKLMSAKKAAKTEKKRRQLRNQKAYDKKQKRLKSNGKRAKSKKGGGPFPLPEVVHSSSGVSGGPDGNVKEDFLADGVTGTRICGVQAEGRREIDSVGCTGSLPTGEYNASGHDGDTNSVVAGDAVDLEDHHGVGDETFQTSWLMHDSNRKCDNCHRRCFTRVKLEFSCPSVEVIQTGDSIGDKRKHSHHRNFKYNRSRHDNKSKKKKDKRSNDGDYM